MRIERDAENAFARVVCRPAAGVDRGRFVLVLVNEAVRPPRPDEVSKERRDKSRRARTRDALKDADAVR
jgi:rod shape-determining protein MreC